jgi:hypothetical protein
VNKETILTDFKNEENRAGTKKYLMKKRKKKEKISIAHSNLI